MDGESAAQTLLLPVRIGLCDGVWLQASACTSEVKQVSPDSV